MHTEKGGIALGCICIGAKGFIPSDLATYGRDAKSPLQELQSQNERMFMVTFLSLNTGKTKQELDNNIFQALSIAQQKNCNLRRLDFQQEQGLMSSLPLVEKTVIDRCVHQIYQKYFDDPVPENMPFWRICTTCCCRRKRKKHTMWPLPLRSMSRDH
jgi:hypothetical protein